MKTNETGEVNQLVEHLFRHKYAQILSILIRSFGVENLQLAEDVVQESLSKALQQWPFSGVPANPGGWILQVAKNQALDVLRREASFRSKRTEIAQQLETKITRLSDQSEESFEDDQLAMMFMCCHPEFSRDVQSALILKNLCGFSVTEIARAFLTQESAIAQRLVRAKRKIKEQKIRFEVPSANELTERIDPVLEVLYLLFNEGYGASEGDSLVRQDLCEEAMRLNTLLASHPAGNQPKVHALLALLLFQASRLATRVDREGNLLLLADQDRSEWDRDLIQRAFHHLQLSSSGNELTEYHLQAGIASCHAMAESYETTDWSRILVLYDTLLSIHPSPVVALNRAVAVSMVAGAQAGLEELKKIENLPEMKSYYLLPATFAEFHLRLGHFEEAAHYFQKALSLVKTDPERHFLQTRFEKCS